MTLDKNKKRLVSFLENNTPAYLQFKGLKLNEDEFITLETLINLEKQENYNKVFALRELGNGIIKKDMYVDEIAYREFNGPELKLLFEPNIVSRFNVSEKFTPKDESEKRFCYTITPEILEYLLESRNLNSKLDHLILEHFKEELHFFKEQIEKGTFYANYDLYDALGLFVVSVYHDLYQSDKIEDSIDMKKSSMGRVQADFILRGDNYFTYTYDTALQDDKISSSYFSLPNCYELPKKLYLHKKALPQVIQDKLK